MTDTENISAYYYENLYKAKAPHSLLASFLCRLFEKDEKDSKYYAMMAKLIRIYGRERVYFAILDLYDMEGQIDWSRTVYPILAYFIKKKMDKDTQGSIQHEDLSDYVASVKKKIKKQKEGASHE